MKTNQSEVAIVTGSLRGIGAAIVKRPRTHCQQRGIMRQRLVSVAATDDASLLEKEEDPFCGHAGDQQEGTGVTANMMSRNDERHPFCASELSLFHTTRPPTLATDSQTVAYCPRYES